MRPGPVGPGRTAVRWPPPRRPQMDGVQIRGEGGRAKTPPPVGEVMENGRAEDRNTQPNLLAFAAAVARALAREEDFDRVVLSQLT